MDLEKEIEIIERGAEEIIQKEELVERLKRSHLEGKSLRVKFGADPTAPDIHLGHTVILRKLRQFQDLGHDVYFIIGDFTAMIGDPSGRDRTRAPLSQEEIRRNASTYQSQVFKILDPNRTKMYYNSKWLQDLGLKEVIKMTSFITVAKILDRDDFKKRHIEGKGIGVHEFLYPLLQAYDSVMLHADIEVGGRDQKFNLLVGRDLQEAYGQSPQVVLTMPLLEGTDGVRKMSKTYGNYIGIDEDPHQIFGKVMSIPDSLMSKYLELLTDLDAKRIQDGLKRGRIHPKRAKLTLAREIVRTYYDEATSRVCEEEFERVFRVGEIPKEIPEFSVKTPRPIIDILVDTGLVESKSEARRMIHQGGVRLDGVKVEDTSLVVKLEREKVLQIGKRRFARLIPSVP
jgi:tyrosyl-tRNA synthetase